MHTLSASVSGNSIPWAGVVPVLVVAGCFVVYCLIDIVRHRDARYLPWWVWALLSVLSNPLGGIAYLLLGRSKQR